MKKSLLFLTLILAFSVNAQTEFTATEDVFVRAGANGDTNYNEDGGEEKPELEIKKGTLEDFFKKTLVKFDLTAAGLVGADVNNARLRLRVMDVQSSAGDRICTVTVSGVTDDAWTEGAVTWNTAPASGTALSTVVGITGTDKPAEKDGPDGVDKYWDVTTFVKTELDGNKIISLALEDFADPFANNTITFSSKAGANAPVLIINDPALSTSDFNKEKNIISLYPNPTTESFKIQTTSDEISSVKIFSIAGSMLFNTNNVNSNSLTVDASAFQTGVYFVHVKNIQGESRIKKIIKK